MSSRKRVQVDDLIWMIHQEVLRRVGKDKQFSIAIAPEKGHGWAICKPAGGRPFHDDVLKAIREVEREFRSRYSIPR